MNYLVTNPFREDVIRLFATKEAATKFALAENRRDDDHPSLRLFEVRGRTAYYVGSLWRAFGMDFDPSDPWRMFP